MQALRCRRDMELIGDPNDHRFHSRIFEHFLVVAIGGFGLPNTCHSVAQIVDGIADRVELGVPGFLAALEMRSLADHSTSEDADAHGIRSLVHKGFVHAPSPDLPA